MKEKTIIVILILLVLGAGILSYLLYERKKKKEGFKCNSCSCRCNGPQTKLHWVNPQEISNMYQNGVFSKEWSGV